MSQIPWQLTHSPHPKDTQGFPVPGHVCDRDCCCSLLISHVEQSSCGEARELHAPREGPDKELQCLPLGEGGKNPVKQGGFVVSHFPGSLGQERIENNKAEREGYEWKAQYFLQLEGATCVPVWGTVHCTDPFVRFPNSPCVYHKPVLRGYWIYQGNTKNPKTFSNCSYSDL